jgi:hypothetical protein
VRKSTVVVTVILLSRLAGFLSQAPSAWARESCSERAEQPAEVEFLNRILWLDAERKSPWFIPEDILKNGLETLPFTSEQKATLNARIDWWGQPTARPISPSGHVIECTGSDEQIVPHPLPDSTDLAGMIKDRSVVFVGTVARSETGWDLWRDEVAQRFDLRFETRIRIATPLRLPAGEVSFVLIGGSMTLRGRRVCALPNPVFFVPKPGDRLLVLGVPGPSGGQAIEAHAYFRLDQFGMVIPQPYPGLRDRTPRSLVDIIDRLARDAKTDSSSAERRSFPNLP